MGSIEMRRCEKAPVYSYSFNPYSSYCATVVHTPRAAAPPQQYYAPDAPESHSPASTARAPSDGPECEAVALSPAPLGPLRMDLFSQLEFLAFPPETYYRGPLRRSAPPRQHRPANITQLFFGQLPFRLTDAMVLFLFDVIAHADAVYIERIVQDNSKKGCMQVYVYDDDVDKVIDAFHKRVLFDQTGVWIAHTPEQRAAMQRHGDNATNRFKGLPFYPMVVERSRGGLERSKTAKVNAGATASNAASNVTSTPDASPGAAPAYACGCLQCAGCSDASSMGYGDYDYYYGYGHA